MNNESKIAAFENEVAQRVKANGTNSSLLKSAGNFVQESILAQYSYNFSWLGRPIIQYPQDIVAVQEIIWEVKPDLIIETGIAHGGSLIMSASMLAMLEYCEAIESSSILDPAKPKRKVLGVDIDIRNYNREAIEKHPMSNRIDMVQGSSISAEIIEKVHQYAADYKKILVCLDSNHTHEHVLKELEAYAPLVTLGSYCIVFDTVIEDLPKEMFPERSWGPGDNPKTAVREFLRRNANFQSNHEIDTRLLISVATEGFLKRVR